MKCKSKLCDLERGHKGKCLRLTTYAAINTLAINSPVSLGAYTPGCGAPVATAEDLAQVTTLTVSRTANRRTRSAYNAYMREYMRKRRSATHA